MSDPYPFLDVMEHRTGRLFRVVVWNVRAISEAEVDGATVTRIEYLNGDVLDAGEDISFVSDLFRHAVASRDF